MKKFLMFFFLGSVILINPVAAEQCKTCKGSATVDDDYGDNPNCESGAIGDAYDNCSGKMEEGFARVKNRNVWRSSRHHSLGLTGHQDWYETCKAVITVCKDE